MQYEDQRTLARLIGSPLRRKRKIAITAESMAQALIATTKNPEPQASPDVDAVRFYGLNQLVSLLFQKFTPHEQLPDTAQSIAAAYEQELAIQHKRMFWYTFLVISREFRHLNNKATVLSGSMFSPKFKTLIPKIMDSTDESHLNTWLALVPDDSLEHYCNCLIKGFDTGSWGGGYGGKPWGQIARTAMEYVAGKTSAEIFIDTAYTLAHNNGPMFNKGMFYMQYTHYFKQLLDIQRSGQICEALLDGTIDKLLPARPGLKEVRDLTFNWAKEFGGIGPYLDWHKVEKDGALGGPYTAQKAAQDKKYGKVAAKQLVSGKPVVFTGGQFEVFPGQTVEIFTRMAA